MSIDEGTAPMHRPPAVLSGVLVLTLAACSSGAPPTEVERTSTPSALPTSASASAEPTTASPTSAAPTPVAAAPEILAPDVISGNDEEYRITFSPDETVAYFARSVGFFPQTRQATILESRLIDGEWTEPTVAPFSGEFPDIDPWMSPDGDSIYFSSIRPVDGVERDDAELFRVDRDGDGWTEPVHLAQLESDTDELGASVSADGRIVFASDRPGGVGGWDLYAAEAAGDAFGDPAPLAALNTSEWAFNPAISGDGTQLVFTSIGRPGGSGLGDLFLASHDGEWTEVGPLTMNTAADEYHASWSAGGETLYFVRRSVDGDLYGVPWSQVAPSR